MNAVTGGMTKAEARELLLHAGIRGLQAKAGYVPDSMGYDWGTHYFVSGYDAPFCYRLQPSNWIEMYLCSEDTRLRYANVHVYHDSIVCFWTHAEEITYEYAGIMITRSALIEMWSSDDV